MIGARIPKPTVMSEQITPAVQDYLKAIHSLGGVDHMVSPVESRRGSK